MILCSKKFHNQQMTEYFTTKDIHMLKNILETYSACISAFMVYVVIFMRFSMQMSHKSSCTWALTDTPDNDQHANMS